MEAHKAASPSDIAGEGVRSCRSQVGVAWEASTCSMRCDKLSRPWRKVAKRFRAIIRPRSSLSPLLTAKTSFDCVYMSRPVSIFWSVWASSSYRVDAIVDISGLD